MLKKYIGYFIIKAKDETGATAIEYGLITAGISIAMMVVVSLLGSDLEATFQAVSDFL